jgi:hypothetical protein
LQRGKGKRTAEEVSMVIRSVDMMMSWISITMPLNLWVIKMSSNDQSDKGYWHSQES